MTFRRRLSQASRVAFSTNASSAVRRYTHPALALASLLSSPTPLSRVAPIAAATLSQRSLLSPALALMGLDDDPSQVLREIQDRRQFDPDGDTQAAGVFTSPLDRRLVPSGVVASKPMAVPVMQGFANPQNVTVCIRRKARREVIFAKRKSGGGHRKPRRNWFSEVTC